MSEKFVVSFIFVEDDSDYTQHVLLPDGSDYDTLADLEEVSKDYIGNSSDPDQVVRHIMDDCSIKGYTFIDSPYEYPDSKYLRIYVCEPEDKED